MMHDMTPARWEQVQKLYHAARARAEADRARFLGEACAGDDLLRSEVQGLLDQPVSTGSFVDFLGGPAPPQLDEQARATLAGRRLGSYQVLALAGRGGMGEVYRAHDDRLGRDVAIKVLPPVFTADADRLARFGGEARALAALNHPHVGAIYGLEDVEGVPALVLEFVEGETLADRLQRGPIPVRDALPTARQIADALDGAHRKGIIHRDLKPANIKITPDGVVKVLDFGLAKAAASEPDAPRTASPTQTAAIGITRAGVILGTAEYMSPERRAACQWMHAPTSGRSAACSSRCSPAGRRSGARPSPKRSRRSQSGSPIGSRCPARRRRRFATCCAAVCSGTSPSGCRMWRLRARRSTDRSAG